MNLGTPRRLLHAARLDRNPELDHHEPTPQHDPVERTVIVDEPAIPNHLGELEGEPPAAHSPREIADQPVIADDIRQLTDDLDTEYFPD